MSENIIAIGIPCMGTIYMQTAMSLLNLVTKTKLATSVIFVKGSLIHDARRKIVKEAQKVKATHLFFMDADMWVEEEAILKMLEHKKDIVGVNSSTKSIPKLSTVKIKGDDGKYIASSVIPDALFECAAVGTGIMLIDMKVFDVIDKPWFFYSDSEDDPIGEDVWFCEQANKKGLKVFCDPTIRVLHIGDYEY